MLLVFVDSLMSSSVSEQRMSRIAKLIGRSERKRDGSERVRYREDSKQIKEGGLVGWRGGESE